MVQPRQVVRERFRPPGDKACVMRTAALLATMLPLAACATTPGPAIEPSGPPLAWAALGETVFVDGPKVTPVSVLEDSRCPVDVRCVWAGRLRIEAKIHLGSGTTARELELGKPVSVADGTLELVEAKPPRQRDRTIAPANYRFGLRFMGGL